MLDKCLSMGCLSSRISSTANPGVVPRRAASHTTQNMTNEYESMSKLPDSDMATSKQVQIVNIGTSLDDQSSSVRSDDSDAGKRLDRSDSEEKDDFTTVLIDRAENNQSQSGELNGGSPRDEQVLDLELAKTSQRESKETTDKVEMSSDSHVVQTSGNRRAANDVSDTGDQNSQETNTLSGVDSMVVAIPADKDNDDTELGEGSFEEELNADLLRQYIVVDYEISQLEDRDALRLYHEKIEQLEQLERELDMISFEAEEVAVRGETDLLSADRNHLFEDGAITTNALERPSAKSSIVRNQNNQQQLSAGTSEKGQLVLQALRSSAKMTNNNKQSQGDSGADMQREFQLLKSGNNNLAYATIEEVFNRKIILEKEREKLKKEVEIIIIECDRLQQKFKKRDEILDKLFEGRIGNGLENHLEQQLNWLVEQKHYVDQVFYAWKRAETLTNKTCEQFAGALEILKRMPKTQDEAQRNELSKSVCNLLIKSRQDMEQAQRYNPNVDAPFFTDAEIGRFDKIIETLQSNSISQSEYNQMASVVQFAYKRAVSIRLWLEQILQITIARDSFELAEEHKWIAIQLRKERISLINLKLQEPPYQAMARSVREQLSGLRQQLDYPKQTAIPDGVEINRDSGVESDDIDIEEDIYRLLEMNKSRLEAAVAASREAGIHQTTVLDSTGRPIKPLSSSSPSSRSSSSIRQQQTLAESGLTNRTAGNNSTEQSLHDKMMRERVQRRVQGEQPLNHTSVNVSISQLGSESLQQEIDDGMSNTSIKQNKSYELDESHKVGAERQNPLPNSASSTLTPSKLRIQLDEESRRNLSKLVEQTHSKHLNKIDNLRGNNKAKAKDKLSQLQRIKDESPG